MSAADATLDDLADAASTLYRLEVRRQAFAEDLPESWRLAVDDMGEALRRVQLAMINAHIRETGQPPARYLSTQRARRCRFEVLDTDRSREPVECGKPSGWRSLAPETMAGRYACEVHEDDLRRDAVAAGARVERLSS